MEQCLANPESGPLLVTKDRVMAVGQEATRWDEGLRGELGGVCLEMELMGTPGEAGLLGGASTVVCLDKRCFLGPWIPAGTAHWLQEAAKSRLVQQDHELEQNASGSGEGLTSGSSCRQSQRQRGQTLDFCLIVVCP